MAEFVNDMGFGRRILSDTSLNDTIVAISTPPGRGGIGMVRLSGAEARGVVEPMLRLRHPLAAGRVRRAQVLDPEDGVTVLDEAVVTYFAAPNSYTTEDVVEVACHGSPVLLETVVRGCLARGARLAEPGEFTERAFLAGRLDLTQAEAVHDLIASSTLQQARVAAAQMGGALSRTVAPVKQRLVELIATLEAGVDFAEDDIDLPAGEEIGARLGAVLGPLERLAATYGYGRIVREGFTLAIVGRPNVGKSSLFNRLLARDRAIVTSQPGTTRDPIMETLALDGIPVQVVDTAGLREAPAGPEGEAERAGIARTGAAMAEADVILQVVDAAEPFTEEDAATMAGFAGRPYLLVANKCDLMAEAGKPKGETRAGAIRTSALTGEGLEELKRAVLATLTAAPAAETALLTNLRQQEAVNAAVEGLKEARRATELRLPHELLLLDLYAALEGLDRLTGTTSTEEILSLIFSTFCIGK